jgi:hypothetical protein
MPKRREHVFTARRRRGHTVTAPITMSPDFPSVRRTLFARISSFPAVSQRGMGDAIGPGCPGDSTPVRRPRFFSTGTQEDSMLRALITGTLAAALLAAAPAAASWQPEIVGFDGPGQPAARATFSSDDPLKALSPEMVPGAPVTDGKNAPAPRSPARSADAISKCDCPHA